MIILDVEASGTEPHMHSIVSIGAFDFDNPDNRFYVECRMWSGAKIMDGALEVNGFTEAEITDPGKQTEEEAVRNFLGWTEGVSERTICGQNPSFDRDFVRAGAARAHLDYSLAYRTLDTHTMCYMHMLQAGYEVPVDEKHRRTMLNLDAVLNYCGIKSEPEPHNALTGALCHGEVASRLLFGKKLLPEFDQFEIPWLQEGLT